MVKFDVCSYYDICGLYRAYSMKQISFSLALILGVSFWIAASFLLRLDRNYFSLDFWSSLSLSIMNPESLLEFHKIEFESSGLTD